MEGCCGGGIFKEDIILKMKQFAASSSGSESMSIMDMMHFVASVIFPVLLFVFCLYIVLKRKD